MSMKGGQGIGAGVGLALFAVAETAEAHTYGAVGSGFLEGVGHPLGGVDHLLAMIAVGLWAAQLGGRAVWRLPAGFICLMAMGAVFALAGGALPLVEAAILASVVVLGAAIAARAKGPSWAPLLLVGAFAVFHGHAHGMELPQTAAPALYGIGFVLSTALLHAAGLTLGLSLKRFAAWSWIRAGGGGIVAAGLAMWLLG